jgi:hypothetical protein
METNAKQHQFKDEERKIAEKFNIEPATVRQIGDIFSETIKGICKLVSDMQGEEKAKPEAVPIEFKSAAEKAGYEIGLKLPSKILKTEQDDRTEKDESEVELIVRDWLLSLPYTAKLAVSIYSGYLYSDHNTDWIKDVRHKFDDDIISEMKNENSQLSDVEKKMTGLACETFVWSYHL